MMKYYKKMPVIKHFFRKGIALIIFLNKLTAFVTCVGVYFLVQLRSEVAIQIFQNKRYKMCENPFKNHGKKPRRNS